MPTRMPTRPSIGAAAAASPLATFQPPWRRSDPLLFRMSVSRFEATAVSMLLGHFVKRCRFRAVYLVPPSCVLAARSSCSRTIAGRRMPIQQVRTFGACSAGVHRSPQEGAGPRQRRCNVRHLHVQEPRFVTAHWPMDLAAVTLCRGSGADGDGAERQAGRDRARRQQHRQKGRPALPHAHVRPPHCTLTPWSASLCGAHGAEVRQKPARLARLCCLEPYAHLWLRGCTMP